MSVKSILQSISHRPYSLPLGNWSYYQEWNDTLFMHWKIPLADLREIVPEQLSIDEFEGNAWVSLVPFTMEKIRPRFLPHWGIVSNFHEINLRTYVTHNGKPGVYFINIEGHKHLSVFLSKALSGLPYGKAIVNRSQKDKLHSYISTNKIKNFSLAAEYEIDEQPYTKTLLDKFLTERYCLYLDKGDALYRYDTHHEEWKLHGVHMKNLKLQYQIGKLNITDKFPDLINYSKGVKVVAWRKVRL